MLSSYREHVKNRRMTEGIRRPPGADLLLDFLRDQRKPNAGPPGFRFSLTEFARHLGASRQQIRMWHMGAVRPNQEHREHLCEISGGRIPVTSWD